jgi:hypothetical protein
MPEWQKFGFVPAAAHATSELDGSDRHAAVDGQRGAGHERTFVADQEEYGPGSSSGVACLAVIATLVAPRGRWGCAADRFGWSLLPAGYPVRPPRE